MIDNIKSKAANLILSRKLSKLKRRIGVFNLSKAKTVGIIYHFDSLENDKVIKDFARFLKEERIKVDTLGYVSNKEMIEKAKPELDYNYFFKKELNFLLIPQKKECLKFAGKEYDILIDLTIKTFFPVKYIASLSKAHFKVGESNSYKMENFDLTIDISHEKSIIYLIKQLKHYLSIIN